MSEQPRPRMNVGGALVGLTMMAVGIVLLLDQTGLVAGLGWRHVWPAVLVGLGLVRLAFPREDGRRDGGWMVFVGALLLMDQLRVLRFRESWPLFIVGIGISMVWKELARRRLPHTYERVE